MVVVIDPCYEELGAKVVSLGGFDVLDLEYKVFPDGEVYFRVLGDVSGRDVGVVVGCFPFGQSDCVLRGLFIVRTLKDLGAGRVVVVFPYFPFARQDKRFLSGECVSARVVAELVNFAGADVIATVDVHAVDVYGFLGDRFVNISSVPVWCDFFRREFGRDFFLVAPDEGRVGVVREMARVLGVPYTGFRKVRDLRTGAIVGLELLDEREFLDLVSQFDIAVVFDDMISTGGTAARVISKMREMFNGRIVAAFTHGLFLPGSVRKLLKAGVSEIVATDTVKNAFSKLSVAPLIVDFLKKVLRE